LEDKVRENCKDNGKSKSRNTSFMEHMVRIEILSELE
jgi:hypothetical protein